MEKDQFKIVKYKRRAYAYADFSCGNASMDCWLKENAGQNERANRARTFLLVNADEHDRTVYGYFSLVNCQLEPYEARLIHGSQYRYSMPAILLVCLAVAEQLQGQYFGGALFDQAMRFTLASLEFSGVEVFVVDAIDTRAISFYQHQGLSLLEKDGMRLYVLTREIARNLDRSSPQP